MNSFFSACSANSTRRSLVSSSRFSFTSHNGSYCYPRPQQKQVVVELTRCKRMMVPSRIIVAVNPGRLSHALTSRRAAFLSTSCSVTSTSSLPLAATGSTLSTPIPDQPPSNSGSNRAWEIGISGVLALTTSLALVWAFPTTTKSICRSAGAGHEALLYATVPSPPAATLAKGQPEISNTAQKRQSSPVLDESSSSQRRMYDVSARAIKGGRVTMEDEYYVADGGRFAAVFDGHGGGGVSTFLKEHLFDTVKKFLAIRHWEERDDHPSRTPSLACQVAALRDAFQQIDNDVLEDDSLRYQGSTAVAVVLHESEDGHRTLLSANVGDSRAILSRRGKAVDLTRDHKPNEEKEKKRILSMGETIEWDRYAKVHRVRNLSLSRAIGDRYAKPIVSGEVEIKHFPVLDDGDEFFLLASDGLWDVMTSQDVVTYVHKRMEKELARGHLDKHDDVENFKLVLRRNMAKFVAREALRRGSGDNICVLMVWLKDMDRSANPSS